MRRLLAGLLLVAAMAPAVAAGGKLGLQVAAVNNTLTGQLPAEGSWEGTRSPGASLLVELDFSDTVSLSLQPGYTPRNSQQVFKRNGEVIGEVDYTLDYITVPLLLRVTGDPVGVRGFVTAGLELSFRLSAEVTEGETTEDLTDQFSSTTLGALFGAGVMVPVGGQFLTFELRYVQGLNDIVERDRTDEIPGISSPSVKYRGLELLAGYVIPLGRR